MSNRRSCDRCYRKKEKCIFEDNIETCTQCNRSAVSCTTLRSRLRPGRRPKAGSLGPRSSLQVWAIEDPSASSITEKGDIETAQRRSQEKPVDATNKASGAEIIESNTGSASASASPSTARRYDSIFTEQLLQQNTSSLDQFYAANDLFMFGPSFAQGFYAAINYSYTCSPDLLQEIYLAVSTATGWARHHTATWEQVDIAKGSISLQKLRTANIAKAQDAVAIIFLGQSLAAFDTLTNCNGSTLILRYCLSLVKPWYSELSMNPTLDPITIAPLLWDTICCLIQQEVPVIRLSIRCPSIVDRVAGLCTTLLPILYDLCMANSRANSTRADIPGTEFDSGPFREIEQRILAWAPTPPSDFTTTYSNQEVLAMRTQAVMYRTAALLMVHRAIFPIGIKDDIALAYANDIILELTKYFELAGPEQRLQNAAFPLFMAMLETTILPTDFWKRMTVITVTPVCVKKLSAFIEFTWKKRQNGFKGFIFDLVREGPDFVIVP